MMPYGDANSPWKREFNCAGNFDLPGRVLTRGAEACFTTDGSIPYPVQPGGELYYNFRDREEVNLCRNLTGNEGIILIPVPLQILILNTATPAKTPKTNPAIYGKPHR